MVATKDAEGYEQRKASTFRETIRDGGKPVGPVGAIKRPSRTDGERQLTGSYQGHQRKTRPSQMGRAPTLNILRVDF